VTDGITNAWSLHLEVVDDEIIVTAPSTGYSVTYYKPANSRHLLARKFTNKDDPKAPMTNAEFLTKTWQVANDKARELGWIA
jgi:hypothetical protein